MVDLTKLSDEELRSMAAMARARVKTKPVTETEQKAAINLTGAQGAQDKMRALREVGFDPTSMMGAGQVSSSDMPFIGGFVDPEAKQQASANLQFAQGLGYLRSGAQIPEHEIEGLKESLIDKYGDDPETSAFKAQSRQNLIDAGRGGSPAVKRIISDILTKGTGMLGPPAQGGASSTAPSGPAAPPGGTATPAPAAPVSQVDYKARAIAAFKSGDDTPERRRMIQELLSD